MAAIAHLASDQGNVAQMIANGNIESIVSLAKLHPFNEVILGAATKSLGLLGANDNDTIDRIILLGGGETCVEVSPPQLPSLLTSPCSRSSATSTTRPRC
jgi:hypothetical protein